MTRRNPLYVDPVMELLEPVLEGLFSPEARRLDKMLEELILHNHTLGGHKHAFIHSSEVFCTVPRRFLRLNGTKDIRIIHPSLEAEAETYRRLRDNIVKDRQRLRQMLSVILPKCRNRQEVRDALPEVLVSGISAFRGMERQHHEGFILDRNPLLKSQYEEAVGLALLYQANQLIY